MDRQQSPGRSKKDLPQSDDHHCILCDVTIEYVEYDVFFTTGRCRICHEALENETADRR